MTRVETTPQDGERGLPAVRRAVAWHTRVSNLVALGLMLLMGATVLSLYYLHTVRQQAQLRAKANAASERAGADAALPELGC